MASHPTPYGFDDREDRSDETQEHEDYGRLQRVYSGPQTRAIMSPPPRYPSPETPTPGSPTPLQTSDRPQRQSYISGHGRHDSFPQTYHDEAPPAPPTHRTSPSRTSLRPSTQSSHGNHILMGQYHSQDSADHLSQGPPRDRTGRDFPPQATTAASLHATRPVSRVYDGRSYSSNIPLAAGAATPGSITPAATLNDRYSARSIPLDGISTPSRYSLGGVYSDSPYYGAANTYHPMESTASINPQDIADDGDDFPAEPQRRSILYLPRSKSRAQPTGPTGGIIPAQAGVAAINPAYGAVPDGSSGGAGGEKSTWLQKQGKGNNKMRWTIGIAIGAVIVIAIVAGILGGVLGTHQSKGGSGGSGSGSTNSAAGDTAANGDLDLDSAEIQALMNNKNLRKVFPGMDYTPWGVQYPLCLTYPPSQNNVTRDLAVLSQLTNTVRLYGTDCNQTEMVLHAIDRLQLKSMKVWLGVWVDTNQTTTDRQLAQMYNILDDTKDRSIFKGAIIGNEALYRAGEDKAQSKQELLTLLRDTRSNFTSLGYDLPVGTSDLGDNWDGDLVAVSDFVMSNIHPFFAGVEAGQAASWTWSFWNNHDIPLTAGNTKVQQIISETGWPSAGGTDCGGTTGDCASGQSGAVASVDNMNTFMADWVCQAMANGTEYFWFEAFDEPWKVTYNTPGKEWEDKWGLMDPARVLKPGIQIPDCNGMRVS